MNFLPGLAQTCNPISIFWVARVTGMAHHTQLRSHSWCCTYFPLCLKSSTALWWPMAEKGKSSYIPGECGCGERGSSGRWDVTCFCSLTQVQAPEVAICRLTRRTVTQGTLWWILSSSRDEAVIALAVCRRESQSSESRSDLTKTTQSHLDHQWGGQELSPGLSKFRIQNLLKIFLLACVSWAGGFIVTFPYVFIMYLN
jgi:hypothetical protein